MRLFLHDCVAEWLTKHGCQPIVINSVKDHIHILFELSRDVSIATVIGDVKRKSSRALRQFKDSFNAFQWQTGYSIFSIGRTELEMVKRYIRNQQAHHGEISFEEEFRGLHDDYGIAIDENYTWD